MYVLSHVFPSRPQEQKLKYISLSPSPSTAKIIKYSVPGLALFLCGQIFKKFWWEGGLGFFLIAASLRILIGRSLLLSEESRPRFGTYSYLAARRRANHIATPKATT